MLQLVQDQYLQHVAVDAVAWNLKEPRVWSVDETFMFLRDKTGLNDGTCVRAHGVDGKTLWSVVMDPDLRCLDMLNGAIYTVIVILMNNFYTEALMNLNILYC
jgi:hypothetical protein